MDEGLNQELSKSLNSLGSQLASISEKFVKDYSELTSKMNQVVNRN